MNTFDEIMKELRDMRGHYDSGFSILEKDRIEKLYWRILHKRIVNTSCPDCYRDAFLEMFTFLQREGKLPAEKHYELIKGKCLHIFGTSDYLFDVTDEQAEMFLAQVPGAIVNFSAYPEDWQERVEKRKKRTTAKKAAEKRAEKRKQQLYEEE